jgi:YVTN family beta-propeller protein
MQSTAKSNPVLACPGQPGLGRQRGRNHQSYLPQDGSLISTPVSPRVWSSLVILFACGILLAAGLSPVFGPSGHATPPIHVRASTTFDGRMLGLQPGGPRSGSTLSLSRTDVVRFSATQVIGSIPVGSSPESIAYDGKIGEIFVPNTFSNNVSVIDDATNKLVASIAVGARPYSIAYDSNYNEMFVGNLGSSNLSVISDAKDMVTANISMNLGTSGAPMGLTYDNRTGEIFVADSGANNVSVINDTSNKLARTIPVGAYPTALAYDWAKREIYVANAYDHNVSVINDTSDKVVVNIQANYGDPAGLAYDPAQGEIFVSYDNSGANTVSVINDSSNTVIGTVTVGSRPEGMSFDNRTQEVFVANAQSNNTSIIDTLTGKVVAGVSGGVNPVAIAYDDGLGEVFIANSGSNNVSVVSDGSKGSFHLVRFVETGLAVGTQWSANLDGIGRSSNQTSINFTVPNGSYPYVIGLVTGYRSSPSAGTILVAGADQNLAVTFTVQPAYLVTFSEAGLPSSATWWVNITGGTSTFSRVLTLSFTEPNGTYGYTVASSGYVANPSNGSLAISGMGRSVAVTFVATYAVSFIESGLPPSEQWDVSLNGTSHGSSSSTIDFSEENGTYSYMVGAETGYSAAPKLGSVTVYGASQSVYILFNATYTVTFRQSGLAGGTSWSVNLSGSVEISSSTSIVFTEQNGTYHYLVGVVSGYTASPGSGYANITGGNLSVQVTYSNASGLVPLTFRESGLTAGTNWSIVLRGDSSGLTIQLVPEVTRWSSGGNSIEFEVSTGTYTYSAESYGFKTSTATLSVSRAAPSTVTISFVPIPPSPHTNSPNLIAPTWGAATGLALLLIVGIVSSLVVYRFRQRERRRGNVLAARLFDTQWEPDGKGDPVPRMPR